jgi:GT2 family glycosyltransferase
MGLDKVAVSIPTVTGRLLVECVESIFQQQEVEPEVLLVRNGKPAEMVCLHCASRWPSVSICSQQENIGVAASWNHACMWAWEKGYDAIFLVNDDIRLTDPLILKASKDAAREDPKRFIVLCHGFSAFYWTRWMWDSLGAFDDGFWPAYFEDKDMLRRMSLQGIGSFGIPKACWHQGSDTLHQGGTVDTRAVHTRAFSLNERRYYMKWGGGLGKETLSVPWDGRVPMESTKVLITRGCC